MAPRKNKQSRCVRSTALKSSIFASNNNASDTVIMLAANESLRRESSVIDHHQHQQTALLPSTPTHIDEQQYTSNAAEEVTITAVEGAQPLNTATELSSKQILQLLSTCTRVSAFWSRYNALLLPIKFEGADPIVLPEPSRNPQHAFEVDAITARIRLSLRRSNVFSIYRIQNQVLWARYQLMRSRIDETAHESLVFHGSRLNDPSSIYASAGGFDLRKAKDGASLWFARNASYSDGYAHLVASPYVPFTHEGPLYRSYDNQPAPSMPTFRQILLCRVIEYTSQSPPPMDTIALRYTTEDIITMHQSERCLPQYLITYANQQVSVVP